MEMEPAVRMRSSSLGWTCMPLVPSVRGVSRLDEERNRERRGDEKAYWRGLSLSLPCLMLLATFGICCK